MRTPPKALPGDTPGAPRPIVDAARRPAVEIAADFPEDLVAIVRPHVTRWLHLLPGWVALLHLSYDHTGDDGVAARMNSLVEYRKAVLILHPAWFMEGAVERDTTIRHELLHVALEPLAQAALGGIRHLRKQNPEAYKLARRAVNHALEACVTDLSLAVGDTPGA